MNSNAAGNRHSGGNFCEPSSTREEKMRKTISVAALLLALTCPAYAGEMQNDSPKPPTSAVQEPTDTDQEPTGGEMPNDAPESLTQTMLDLLTLLPSLL